MSNNTVIQSNHQIPKITKSLEHKTLSNCVESLEIAKISNTFLFVLTRQLLITTQNELLWNPGNA
ncbi:MAG: hypothetical protein V7K67_14520 [Nostoc sp.]|uniref:hypothetical protein n=1 Tax=Nostoc sp. TaxID=1180 RepID=UPI002FF2D729